VPTKESGVIIRVISDTKDILQIENQWNSIVNNYSNNPFLLTEFTKRFIEYIPKGWSPMILTISSDKKIIGIAPLKTKQSVVGRHVEFIHPSWCSEFIFDDQYKDKCIKYTVDFLFKTLRCYSGHFTLPGDSPNLKLLNQQCKLKKIHLGTAPEMARRIIPIKSTWTDYEASRTRKFRNELKRIERNLNKTGSWTVTHLEGNENLEIIRKIRNVEKRSWKETWRNQKGEKDWILTSVIEAAQQIASTEPNFKWSSWFLELEGKTIAYILVIRYKEVAYLVKTSYDGEYKRFYPGIIVQNSAIQQLFSEQQNKYIDFLSDLPYLGAWTNNCLSRITVQLTKGIIPSIIHFVSTNDAVVKILSALDVK
jgi:hypothetical protein